MWGFFFFFWFICFAKDSIRLGPRWRGFFKIVLVCLFSTLWFRVLCLYPDSDLFWFILIYFKSIRLAPSKYFAVCRFSRATSEFGKKELLNSLTLIPGVISRWTWNCPDWLQWDNVGQLWTIVRTALSINVIAFRTLPEMHDDVYFYAPIVPSCFLSYTVFAISCVCVLVVLRFALPSCPAHAFKRDLPG